MNTAIKKTIAYGLGLYLQVNLWYKERSRKTQLAILGFAVLTVVLIVKILFTGDDIEDVQKNEVRRVVTASVSSLSNNEQGFPLVGTVTSVSEATIRSESGGKLVRVYKKLGDSVYAGGILAEFDNSGERAALLQAEGAYEQAKALRDIASLNNNQSGASLADTKSQALNAITSAYTSMDDAIRGKTDQAYADPKFQQVKLLITVPDAILALTLENKRRSIETMLRAREEKNRTLTQESNLVQELTIVQSEATTIKSYLDDLFTAYSKALPDSSFTQTTLDTGKTNVQSARQGISTTISSLVASRTALTASMTANQVAGDVVDGKSSGTLASADAQVKQALGAYNAALSRLQKTIIRSPITGTLNSFSINTGDYIPAFTQVAVVSNNGSLEVVSFVNEEDARRITVSSPVVINGTIAGIVTRIASAIDPTNKKIEVRIGIKDTRTSLINGQSVSVVITKNKKETKVTTGLPIIIPLSSLKLTPRGAVVFRVTASSTLSAIPVREGAILGEQIQILEGLTGSEEIVVDARGLKEGMVVALDNL